MKKCIINCWYGDWPNYFQAFLNACKFSKSWNWLIFTDNKIKQETIPPNVKINFLSFRDLNNLFQSRFSFPINLKTPYKLCDFRPAYGYIFQDFLKGYDYWGHCDLDVIFGGGEKEGLSLFYPDELIKKYDRFLCYGHLSLYKNTEINNKLFMEPISKAVDYQVIFKSKYNWGFDEIGRYSITTILKKIDNYMIYYDARFIADICPFGDFRLVEHAPPNKAVLQSIKYVKVSGGKVYAVYEDNNIIEKAYVHLQKRKIIYLDKDLLSIYYIYGNSIRNSICEEDKNIILREPDKISLRVNQVKRALDIIKYHHQ